MTSAKPLKNGGSSNVGMLFYVLEHCLGAHISSRMRSMRFISTCHGTARELFGLLFLSGFAKEVVGAFFYL